ncbi:dihydrodipicolinate synthase family protein [Halomonas sp. DP5Y7-2]|uniref:dihydrodipicolinate synthase family protein n=1 Tax=Halomonas sp. DP5Y7-2 TaxID=2859076 RepID=UPI001C991A44|nr:dihydrodipicolinate synthase family protein [Halomonas sp. DP5Y7-2]MBY5984870.1 dihydrodipicolinate synthase family protein [Halomonas sp. DP5Y7-2]
MNANHPERRGSAWAPVITPFTSSLSVDTPRLIDHCRWLQSHGVGLAVFGTNSEANSLSVTEKRDLLSRLERAGLNPARMMPGTGHCAIDDSVALTRDAVQMGAAGVLMLPPFYYKGVSDEGLFRYYAEVIERVGDSRLKVFLYHIPPVAQVPLSLGLIERLRDAFPQTVVGIKDSGGDWAHTLNLIERFAADGFEVYAGSERFLLDTLRAGGAGCISATANVNPAAIAALAGAWQDADADQRQAGLNQVRDLFESYPVIPAMKAAKASFSGVDDWHRLRPPLVELDSQRRQSLLAALEAQGFSMPEGKDVSH